MGAEETAGEKKNDAAAEKEEEMEVSNREDREMLRDIEKGKVGDEKAAIQGQNQREFHMSNMQRLSATNPLRLVVESSTRVTSASPAQSHPRSSPHPSSHPRSSPHPSSLPRSTPTTQQSLISLNSRRYTNGIFLFLFLLHLIVAIGLVGFLIFKGVQGLIEAGAAEREEKKILKYFLPQVEAASLLSVTLALFWQKALRVWPKFMVYFIVWSSFLLSLSAGILLICFQRPATDGIGVVFVFFAIGNGLYACWVSQRTGFCIKILIKALEPVPKFHNLNEPTYYMLGAGFLWMSLWILAVVGSLNFYYPPLVILFLVLSLAWITEVMRNVVNLTVSRVISLYYMRGMQSSTHFCFQRALTINLGSACLGSLFVPAIEALRIIARGLNLIEGEDEFMFCCARCGLKIMDSIFKCGNGWAFVQIAAYGKGFVQASKDIWDLLERREIAEIADSDLTSSICFLSGICSGSICVIVVAAWTYTVRPSFVATISLLAAFVGYLMTRIAMALPHACVNCYYVCYTENPNNRLFDKTIQDRLNMIKAGRDVVVPTPRSVPQRFVRR